LAADFLLDLERAMAVRSAFKMPRPRIKQNTFK